MKIANFTDAFGVLMKNEGGFTDDPKDPGNWSLGKVGEGFCEGTMFGITCMTARRNGYTGPMNALPIEKALEIAKKEYWDPYLLDGIDPEVAFQVLDTSYNGGKPTLWLQEACGAVMDGKMGTGTVAKINSCTPKYVIMRFNAYRIKYLAGLRIWPDFGKGWMNRIANNLIEGAD